MVIYIQIGLSDTFEDGYFKTGDIAEIDEEGFVNDL